MEKELSQPGTLIQEKLNKLPKITAFLERRQQILVIFEGAFKGSTTIYFNHSDFPFFPDGKGLPSRLPYSTDSYFHDLDICICQLSRRWQPSLS